uniref:Bromo domain-containing protein n=1 Tax=Oryzias latipes TaxID=8090 RepID=H2L6B3_ORYLA
MKIKDEDDDDFALMFNNACMYNEPESLIYRDALVLHRVLLETRKQQGGEDSGPPAVRLLVRELIRNLFVSVISHQDEERRCYSDSLAEIFAVDPAAPEKPPLNFEIIQMNVERGRYRRLDVFQEHMFEVLKKEDILLCESSYIETEKQVKKLEGLNPPPVGRRVMELLRKLYVSVMSHQSKKHRCYSDFLAEIPAVDPAAPEKPPLNFEIIRMNLERGRYRRLDVFQEHMFEVLKKARRLHRTDSKIFEDAVELQYFLIKIRDELCKNGEILMSTALRYTLKHLQSDVDREKREKVPREIEEDRKKAEEEQEKNKGNPWKPNSLLKYVKECSFDNITYSVGEFVYVEPSEVYFKPHIVCIDRLWEDSAGNPQRTVCHRYM